MLQKEDKKELKKIEKLDKKLVSLERKKKEYENACEFALNKSGCQEFSIILQSYVEVINKKISKVKEAKMSLENNLSNIEYEKI